MSKSLTTQQKAFIENFTIKAPGNAKKSAEMAGYKHPGQQGYELKNKLALEIEEANRKLLQANVPLAIQTLKDLIEDSKTPGSVKLGAVNSILDRNNYSGVIKTEDVTQKKTDKQLQTELNHLLSTLKNEAPIIEIIQEDPEKDTKH